MSLSVRYTRGFLLDLKRRLSFVQRAHDLLEMKRDQEIRELGSAIDRLRELRVVLEKRIEEVLRDLAMLQAVYGSQEIISASMLMDERIEIEVLPRNVMGVNVPMIKIVRVPEVKGRYPLHIEGLAEKVRGLLEDLLRAAELEAFVELIAEDLRKTSIRVNALEKVIIPSYEAMIRKIGEVVEQSALEDFIRVKLVKRVLERRRTE
ncbi:MAG: V-type ATP synthase subunit D [Thaumarchaeota archaeon]|jgi:V/A-type H+-transporting ATPase subunit D|nr:V-type ATP synthase subunit D [Candidatus Wolframiiraptor allenii]MCL7393948.1 V-type ATP synthase subunit D [Candidatus Wolframiiraptor allenii]